MTANCSVIALKVLTRAFLFSIVFAHPIRSVAQPLRTVALSGQPAPGASGALFGGFSEPVLNIAGQTAFHAALQASAGVDSSNDDGYWSEGTGSLRSLIREGDPAPGAPDGSVFGGESRFSRPFINAAGDTAFRAPILVPGGDPLLNGIWRHQENTLELIARGGGQAPDTSTGDQANATFFTVFLDSFNNRGNVSIYGYLDRPTWSGIWSDRSGSLLRVVKAGSHPPGTPVEAQFSGFGATSLNTSGDIAIYASWRIPGPPRPLQDGIWFQDGDVLQLVARQGDTAPGLPTGSLFDRFYGYAGINDAGKVAFYADTYVPGGFLARKSVWTYEDDSLRLIARVGQQAPGVPSETFRTLGLALVNATGETVFRGSLDDDDDVYDPTSGIWAERDGGVQLIVLEGDLAPGITTNAEFAGVGDFSVNAAGQIAFEATLQQGLGDIDLNNDVGLWAETLAGQLTLIAREGDQLEVAPGDLRTISQLNFESFSGNQDGRASAFNDRGQLAFAATFTDGSSGIFVSNAVAVPEPRLAMLPAPLALLFLHGRRRSVAALPG